MMLLYLGFGSRQTSAGAGLCCNAQNFAVRGGPGLPIRTAGAGLRLIPDARSPDGISILARHPLSREGDRTGLPGVS